MCYSIKDVKMSKLKLKVQQSQHCTKNANIYRSTMTGCRSTDPRQKDITKENNKAVDFVN